LRSSPQIKFDSDEVVGARVKKGYRF
jgi:hypothetical protein